MNNLDDLDIYDERFNSALGFIVDSCAGRRYVNRAMIRILAEAAGATENDTETFYLACLQKGVHLPLLVVSDDLFDPPSEIRFW